MALGVLKSKSVFINQIVASLREPLKLKDAYKRLSSLFLKENDTEKAINFHLESFCDSISKDNFILMNGRNISTWKA